MKRTATSASRSLERISPTTPTTYSSTARQSRISRRELASSSSPQQSRRPSLSSRPATSITTTRPSIIKLSTPAQRLYSSTQPPQTSQPPPESSHFLREDTNAPPSKPQTHYALFPRSLPAGLPPSGPFTINLNELKREFLQLQAVAHPDRHSGVNKLRAEAASSAINEAYRTLEDPLRRANYLLELKGWETEECDKMGGEFTVPGHGSLHPSADSGANETDDMELLMEVMEAREAVEDAKTEEDVQALKEENGERIADSIRVLEEAFAKDDLAAAKRESVRLRYWRNIGESLREWEGKGSQHVLNH